jgi:hypothetical protein
MENKKKEIDYTKPPPDEVFEDIKKNAIKVWQRYDNQFGDVNEKVNQIKELENVGDNAWFIVAMFDWDNKTNLCSLLSRKAVDYVFPIIMEEQKVWRESIKKGIFSL